MSGTLTRRVVGVVVSAAPPLLGCWPVAVTIDLANSNADYGSPARYLLYLTTVMHWLAAVSAVIAVPLVWRGHRGGWAIAACAWFGVAVQADLTWAFQSGFVPGSVSQAAFVGTESVASMTSCAPLLLAIVVLGRIEVRTAVIKLLTLVSVAASAVVILASTTMPVLVSPDEPAVFDNPINVVRADGLVGTSDWIGSTTTFGATLVIVVLLIRGRHRLSMVTFVAAMIGNVANGVLVTIDRLDRSFGFALPWMGTAETLGNGDFVLLASFFVAFAALVLTYGWEHLIRPRMELARPGQLIIKSAPDGRALLDSLPDDLGDPSAVVMLRSGDEWLTIDGRKYKPSTSGRSRVVIRRDGETIAAVDHDAQAIPAGQLQLVAGLAGLAIENARLDALVLARVDSVRTSAQRLVEASEHARQVIDQELRDGPLRQLDDAIADIAAGQPKELVVDRLRQALDSVRSISRTVSPATLSTEGLAAALADFAADYPNSQVTMRSQARMPRSVEVTAYRLATEAVPRGCAVTIVVKDDSVVFTAVPAWPVSAGLRERVETLDGSVDHIDGRITVRLPTADAPVPIAG